MDKKSYFGENYENDKIWNPSDYLDFSVALALMHHKLQGNIVQLITGLPESAVRRAKLQLTHPDHFDRIKTSLPTSLLRGEPEATALRIAELFYVLLHSDSPRKRIDSNAVILAQALTSNWAKYNGVSSTDPNINKLWFLSRNLLNMFFTELGNGLLRSTREGCVLHYSKRDRIFIYDPIMGELPRATIKCSSVAEIKRQFYSTGRLTKPEYLK